MKMILIIGAMKCGTTSLFHLLSKHPQIASAREKEPDFFSKDEQFSKGLAWYDSLFDLESDQKSFCLEASVSYTKLHLFPDTPSRIASINRPVKLIYIVRNPIERIESHYTHGFAAGWKLYVSDDEVDEHTIETSSYFRQIRPYFDLFGEDCIHVVSLKQLVDFPQESINSIYKFLGLKVESKLIDLAHKNSGSTMRRLSLFHNAASNLYKAILALGITVPQPARKWINERFFKPVNRYHLNQHQKEYVSRRLSKDLKKFKELFPGVL